MILLRCGTILRGLRLPVGPLVGLPKLKGPILKGATMSATAQTLRPPSRALMLLEGRAIHELGAFLGALPLLSLAPRGDGHPVLVLPGLPSSHPSTPPLPTSLNSPPSTS